MCASLAERCLACRPAGVASNGVFAGLMLALAAGALNNGVLQPPPLFPDWSELGSTPVAAAITIATVVPVLLNCDVCHQSLHPLMPLLQVCTQVTCSSQQTCLGCFSSSDTRTSSDLCVQDSLCCIHAPSSTPAAC